MSAILQLHVRVEEDTVDDMIERTIEIDAPAERLWPLVSSPGWWINGGEIRDHRIDHRDGFDVITDPGHGAHAVVTECLDAPRYAAFRARPGTSSNGPTTLIEFWITDRPAGVALRVRESRFAAMGFSDREQQRRMSENAEGWELELFATRQHVGPIPVPQP